MDARPPFELVSSESSSEEVPLFYHSYITPFQYHKDGAGIMMNPSEGRKG